MTKEEAGRFIQSFGKLNAEAMFNEVDVDADGGITRREWEGFWRNVRSSSPRVCPDLRLISRPPALMVQVRASGYSEEDMLEEVQNMASGQSWVYTPPRTDPRRRHANALAPCTSGRSTLMMAAPPRIS